MDASSSKFLESATYRTLHAHNFTRSSSTASHVLTDLLSRYLHLLATTCAQYAQHAGRSGPTVGDAVLALDELGISVDDLTEFYETDGRELGRYAVQTTRRTEELAEFKASLLDGLQDGRDGATALIWARVPTPPPLQDDEDEGMEDVGSEEDWCAELARIRDEGVVGKMLPSLPVAEQSFAHSLTPLLPPSPVSNASPPPRKRPRLASWKPPSHIPEFLPPFPTSSPSTPLLEQSMEPFSPQRIKSERPLTPPPQLSSSASTADYLTPVPYSMSSISSVLERHLPRPPSPSLPDAQLQQIHHPTPQVTPSLLKAYHHVLTNKPPPNAPINPARHKVAMSLLSQAYSKPRWSPADTLFSISIPGPPRVMTPIPSYPVPVKDPSLSIQDSSKDKEKLAAPPVIPRTVVISESITHMSNQPMSRIPDIARQVLAPSVLTRVTKMVPPQPLIRGASEKVLFGPGIPAPWNSTTPTPAPGPSNAKSKDQPNGKLNGKEVEQPRDTLPDSLLFATWEYEPKDFRVPLTLGKKSRPAPPVWTASNIAHPSHLGTERRKGDRHERKS